MPILIHVGIYISNRSLAMPCVRTYIRLFTCFAQTQQRSHHQLGPAYHMDVVTLMYAKKKGLIIQLRTEHSEINKKMQNYPTTETILKSA